jgi:hypothetical protein
MTHIIEIMTLFHGTALIMPCDLTESSVAYTIMAFSRYANAVVARRHSLDVFDTLDDHKFAIQYCSRMLTCLETLINCRMAVYPDKLPCKTMITLCTMCRDVLSARTNKFQMLSIRKLRNEFASTQVTDAILGHLTKITAL